MNPAALWLGSIAPAFALLTGTVPSAIPSTCQLPADAAPPRYELRIVATPAGGVSMATSSESSAGLVLGLVQLPTGGSLVPAVWSDGKRRDLPLPVGTTQGAAEAANLSGVVVGTGNGSLGERSFVYRDGEMSLLRPLEGERCVVTDINDAGVAVGASSDAYASHPHAAVLWTPQGVPHALGSPHSGNAIARAINASNQIVGEISHYLDGERPFLWSGGHFQVLPLFDGDHYGRARDINDGGVIVGDSGRDVWNLQACAWISGEPIALPMPEGMRWSIARSINASGAIVGEVSEWVWGTRRPVLWIDGSVHFVEDLLLPAAGWSSFNCVSIDDAGRIIGYGIRDGLLCGFILSPSGAP